MGGERRAIAVRAAHEGWMDLGQQAAVCDPHMCKCLIRSICPPAPPPFPIHPSARALQPPTATTDASTMTITPPRPSQQIKSEYLRHPLSEEMENEEIFLGSDAIQVVKYHGSYQQVRAARSMDGLRASIDHVV
jgi:hypothetical protein